MVSGYKAPLVIRLKSTDKQGDIYVTLIVACDDIVKLKSPVKG